MRIGGSKTRRITQTKKTRQMRRIATQVTIGKMASSSSSDLEELEHRKSVLEESLEEKRRMIRKKRKQKLREEIADKERELEETDKEIQEIDDESYEQPQQQIPQDGLPSEESMQLKKAKTPHKRPSRSRKTGMNKQPSISDTKSEESTTKQTDDSEKDKPQEHEKSSSMLKEKITLTSTERKRSQSTSDGRKRKTAQESKKLRHSQRDNRGRFSKKKITKKGKSTPTKQQRQHSLEILPTSYIQDTDTSRSPSLITQNIKTMSRIYSSSEDSDMIYIAPTDTHIRETKARKIKDDKLMKSVKVILQRFVPHKQTSKETIVRIPVETGHHSEELSSNESIKVIKTVKSTKTPKIVIKKQLRSSRSLSSDQPVAKKTKWQNRECIDNRPKKIVVQDAKYMRFMGKDIRGIHRRKKARNTRKRLQSKRRRKIEKEIHEKKRKEVERLIEKHRVKTDEYSSFNLSFCF